MAPTSMPRGRLPGSAMPVGKGSRTVLLVDDDTDVLALVGETMASMGHTVVTAPDGCQALHQLIDNRTIDCLFADVVMSGGMNGMQLVAAARAIRPDLPALLASSYPRDQVCAMGEIPDGVCFISKPYLLSDLHEHLYWGSGAPRSLQKPAPRPLSRTPKSDHRQNPNRLWLGAGSKTVQLGESWIYNTTDP